MSRSYKCFPLIKDTGKAHSRKYKKTIENRCLRRKLKNPEYEIASAGEYRKHSNQWYLIENIWYRTKKDAIRIYKDYANPKSSNFDKMFLKSYPRLNDYIHDWEMCFLRK